MCPIHVYTGIDYDQHLDSSAGLVADGVTYPAEGSMPTQPATAIRQTQPASTAAAASPAVQSPAAAGQTSKGAKRSSLPQRRPLGGRGMNPGTPWNAGAQRAHDVPPADRLPPTKSNGALRTHPKTPAGFYDSTPILSWCASASKRYASTLLTHLRPCACHTIPLAASLHICLYTALQRRSFIRRSVHSEPNGRVPAPSDHRQSF